MSAKSKGSDAEYRCMRRLEKLGYLCIRSSASHSIYDVIAIGPNDVKCIQVKYNTSTLSRAEREAIKAHIVPKNVSKEYWRYIKQKKDPVIEVISTITS